MPGVPRRPHRTCVGCRTSRPQSALLRLARTSQGVRFDPKQRLEGRGVYICPDHRCVAAATRRGAGTLRRALRGGDEDQIRAALDALRTEVVQGAAGTVRSENA